MPPCSPKDTRGNCERFCARIVREVLGIHGVIHSPKAIKTARDTNHQTAMCSPFPCRKGGRGDRSHSYKPSKELYSPCLSRLASHLLPLTSCLSPLASPVLPLPSCLSPLTFPSQFFLDIFHLGCVGYAICNSQPRNSLFLPCAQSPHWRSPPCEAVDTCDSRSSAFRAFPLQVARVCTCSSSRAFPSLFSFTKRRLFLHFHDNATTGQSL